MRWRMIRVGEHVSGMITESGRAGDWLAGWLAGWLAERFAGKRAAGGGWPHRPGNSGAARHALAGIRRFRRRIPAIRHAGLVRWMHDGAEATRCQL
ncbi:hypothetical protein QCN29_23760 [Streptomyces sp. HNM0663]|uniref:Uncharacterized protein n=1 Tax=Streptomyces chengmaiensis TaxID=3040919 RepID=A0ABT6HSQ0_9ACTN|nr:hypothetical protein [Streptomyces chengmaiensis]MDH2391739.1 hypothetical protein [Streptomyces chengmaiensis]